MQSNTNAPHIVILGAGSIGCYLGGCLMANNSLVTLIGRARIQQQLSEHGLHATDYRGRDTHVDAKHINFSLEDSALTRADYILVTVKSGDSEAAAKSIAALAKPQALVVSFQNGLHNADLMQKYLPKNNVLKGMVPFNVVSSGDGHFHCGTEGDLALEDPKNKAKPLVEALEHASLPVKVFNDLRGIQWGKLVMNLNNAVNALSGVPLRDQLNDANYRKVMASVTKEAITVMRAAGIKPAKTGKVIPALLPHILSLPTWLFKRVASAMIKMDPEARSSMYEDLQFGRLTEIDVLNGEIVSLAKSVNLDAPINSAIVELIKQAEQKQTGSPMMSANDMIQQVYRNNN